MRDEAPTADPEAADAATDRAPGDRSTPRPHGFTATARSVTAARFPDLDEDVVSLGVALVRVAHHHAALSESLLHRPRGRSWMGFRVLYVLWVFDSLTARDLSRHMQVSRQTISNVLRSLEDEGLVERSRDARDQRLMTIRLTARGREVIEEALQAQFALDAAWFDVLTPTERRQLVDMLERVRARIGAPELDASNGSHDRPAS
jgi:DNA-binding MarR family transcriptional regulator